MRYHKIGSRTGWLGQRQEDDSNCAQVDHLHEKQRTNAESAIRKIAPRLIAALWPIITALAVTSSASGESKGSAAINDVPTVRGAFAGSSEVVFDTVDSCELIDIPDAPAHAFRDYQNKVHLISTHYVARAMVGSNLDTVRRDCRVIYRSPNDPNPADFQYHNWLYSFFTVDGRSVAALVHSEFDSWEIPGQCATPQQPVNCWWNTITFAQSGNGGYSFVEPEPPGNLVASLPYPYVSGNSKGAQGYTSPTNIIKKDGFYYALVNAWPSKSQQYGPCLIRTRNVLDPSSWRAWDGHGYSATFIDPYRKPTSKPGEHVCQPVYAGLAESLVEEVHSNTYITTQFTPDRRFGPPGLYVMASRDLQHWSKPSLVASDRELVGTEAPGRWSYGYSSLLDPTSRDRNFSTIESKPYVYYVRFDQNHSPYRRELLRRRITIELTK